MKKQINKKYIFLILGHFNLFLHIQFSYYFFFIILIDTNHMQYFFIIILFIYLVTKDKKLIKYFLSK